MMLDIQDKNVLQTFDNISEYVSYATDTLCDMEDEERASRRRSRDLFNYSPDFDSFIAQIFKGFPEARSKSEPIRNLLINTISPHLIQKKPRYEIVGDVIDMPRHLQGIPDPFIIKYEPKEGITAFGKSKQVFRIVVNFTYVCHTVPNEIIHRGAAIVAFVDLLESLGKRVEIIGMLSLQSDPWASETCRRIQQLVVFKEAGHPLDIDLMYLCLAHPDMLRRLGFSTMEMYPENVRNTFGIYSGGYYGYPTAPQNQLDHDLYLPHVLDRSAFGTPELTHKWLFDLLKKQGVIDENTL